LPKRKRTATNDGQDGGRSKIPNQNSSNNGISPGLLEAARALGNETDFDPELLVIPGTPAAAGVRSKLTTKKVVKLATYSSHRVESERLPRQSQSVSPPREILNISDDFSPRLNAGENGSARNDWTKTQKVGQITIHCQKDRNEAKWGDIDPQADTLALTDSNGKRWAGAPRNWDVHAYSGAMLGDVYRLLSNVDSLPPNIKNIIIAVGTNMRANRDSLIISWMTRIEAIFRRHPTINFRFLRTLIDPRIDKNTL
jgi:hypothetical protein